MMTEMDCLGGGGGGSTQVDFTAVASQTVECEIGDYVVAKFTRNGSGTIQWNGGTASESADCVSYVSHGSNVYTFFFLATQATNTLSVVSGTITGFYRLAQ